MYLNFCLYSKLQKRPSKFYNDRRMIPLALRILKKIWSTYELNLATMRNPMEISANTNLPVQD